MLNFPNLEPFNPSDSEAPTVRANEEKDVMTLMRENNQLLHKIKRRLKKQGQRLDSIEASVSPQSGGKIDTKGLDKKPTPPKSEKSFLQKLGDAVVKAVPMLLNTVAAAIFNAFWQGKGIVRRPRKLLA